MKFNLIAAAAALALSATAADARSFQEMFPTQKYEDAKAQQFVESLDYKAGTIALDASGVQLKVPKGFYFLAAQDSRRVLVEAWRNPPQAANGVLGMIMPADRTPLDDAWGAIITYDEDGYVSDEDAAKIDYTDLLKNMQQATDENSAERVKQGFGSIRLIGWASPPYYDKDSHKLHWAKEIEFDGTPDHTLNYDVRALGRKGVLNINFVAGIGQLGEIKGVIPAVMSMPEFMEGSRYADYVPGVDKVAAYGIGGLIAGKVLAKTGLFIIALAFLKKGWILIILALGGLWKYVMRMFRGSSQS